MAETNKTSLLLRRDRVEWTTLRDRRGAAGVSGQCAAALEIPAAVADLTDPDAVSALKSRCSGIKGPLALSLPTDQGLLRVMRLPTTDPAELASMVELQVDKFSPLPLEQLLVGYEVLDQQEAFTRILIAVAPREVVEKLGHACELAGLRPTEVDVDVMGWWRLLKDAGKLPAEGRHILLSLGDGTGELILLQDGVPVVLRAVAFPRGTAPAEAAQELAEEIQYTLTMLEAEWGARPTDSVRVWHGIECATEFLDALRVSCGLPFETHALSELPSLTEGLARRALDREKAGRLDLAPPEWKTASAQRRSRRNLLVGVSLLVGVWLIALATFIVLLFGKDQEVRSEGRKSAGLTQSSAQVRVLKNQLEALEAYSDRTYGVLECFRDICLKLPPGVDLTSFTYKKSDTIAIRAESANSGLMNDFTRQLEDSELFREVKDISTTDDPRRNRSTLSVKLVLADRPEEAVAP